MGHGERAMTAGTTRAAGRSMGGMAALTRSMAWDRAAGQGGDLRVTRGAGLETARLDPVWPMAGHALVVTGKCRLGGKMVVTLGAAFARLAAPTVSIVAIRARSRTPAGRAVAHRSIGMAVVAGAGGGGELVVDGVTRGTRSVAMAGDRWGKALRAGVATQAARGRHGDIGAKTVALQAIDSSLAENRPVCMIAPEAVAISADGRLEPRKPTTVTAGARHGVLGQMAGVAAAGPDLVPLRGDVEHRCARSPIDPGGRAHERCHQQHRASQDNRRTDNRGGENGQTPPAQPHQRSPR